jgi:N-acetylated-alpha-linked acidic dipeptidase
VKKLADAKRDEGAAQAKLLAAHAYDLAADPTEPHAAPAVYVQSPPLPWAPLEASIARLKTSAHAYDTALAAKGPGLSEAQRDKLSAQLQGIDQLLLRDEGLPGRPWYKNMVYAPGRFTGYGAKTLPAVREAIEERRYADATHYIGITAQALDAYAAKLDQATRTLNGQ